MLAAWNRHKKAKKAAKKDPMPLAEFLAEEEGYEVTALEDFANQYATRGQKLIAATTHSMLNDKYFAEWLALNVPFRKLEDFERNAPEIVVKVNQKYRNMALCLHYAPDFWTNDAAIQAGCSPAPVTDARPSVKGMCFTRYLYSWLPEISKTRDHDVT